MIHWIAQPLAWVGRGAVLEAYGRDHWPDTMRILAAVGLVAPGFMADVELALISDIVNWRFEQRVGIADLAEEARRHLAAHRADEWFGEPFLGEPYSQLPTSPHPQIEPGPLYVFEPGAEEPIIEHVHGPKEKKR